MPYINDYYVSPFKFLREIQEFYNLYEHKQRKGKYDDMKCIVRDHCIRNCIPPSLFESEEQKWICRKDFARILFNYRHKAFQFYLNGKVIKDIWMLKFLLLPIIDEPQKEMVPRPMTSYKYWAECFKLRMEMDAMRRTGGLEAFLKEPVSCYRDNEHR